MYETGGRKVGNVRESKVGFAVMKGAGPADLREVSVELAAWMFYLADRTPSVDQGRQLASELIANGSALARFREIIKQQGGDVGVIGDPRRLPQAQHQSPFPSPPTGSVNSIQ